MRFLVVDDDPDHAFLLSEQLRRLGHEVEVRTTGFDGLLSGEAWSGVDVAVVDLWLTPTGFEEGFPVAVSILRWLADTAPGVRRILLSGVEDIGEWVPGVDSLAQVILKPASATDIIIAATSPRSL